jgi:predicted dehydrogenase
MANKVRWGILGTAGIAVRKAIPAMQKSDWVEVAGIASRDLRKAEEAAHALGIPQAYGSYEELLADPKIEAIYNPLPNHLHVPWSIKAAEAGKHVLCEKPVSVSVAEARTLLAVQQRTGVLIAEGFMVRCHPQWVRAGELIRAGRVGKLSAIQGAFSYFNTDPRNIRNIPECGGGSLMDIGCYAIHTSRFLFGEEPVRVLGLMDQDPELKVDRLTSAVMEFPSGQSVFTCSMQLVYHQRLQLFGTLGRIEMRTPFTPPPDLVCQILIDDGQRTTTETFPLCNQFTIQAEVFSRAVREGTGVPVPLTDAIENMAVIEAIFRSAKSGRWEAPAT